MTTFYLIRHGHNDFLGKHKLAGRMPNVHLSSEGCRQAEALGRILSSVKFEAIYASPLERAVETAEPLAREQGLDILIREGLIEIGYGSWQGQSLKALRRRKLWPIIQKTPSLARFPEGESFPEAQARVVAELEALRDVHRRSNQTRHRSLSRYAVGPLPAHHNLPCFSERADGKRQQRPRYGS